MIQDQGPVVTLGGRHIGPGFPTYFVAELSGNHGGSLERAVRLVREAKAIGADAVKLQTYTADTMTLDREDGSFRIQGGIWDGRSLYSLYQEAHTPWSWHAELKAAAEEVGITLFSSPFDATAVEFLEQLHIPAYKIASFELVDLPLIRTAAATGKPLVISTGMGTLDEISEALAVAQQGGAAGVILLKCTSAYPADPADMHLRAICDLAERFKVPVGLSDHTLSDEAAICAVALGACFVEKHLTLVRKDGGPDAKFSLEPEEFGWLVEKVRVTEKLLGTPQFGPSEAERRSLGLRRSLFVVQDVKSGEPITRENVRAIRPADGLLPRHYDAVLGRRAKTDLAAGTALGWEHLSEGQSAD